jgi:hypothetical protein
LGATLRYERPQSFWFAELGLSTTLLFYKLENSGYSNFIAAGTVAFSQSSSALGIDAKRFFVGFEWIESRADRAKMLAGLRDWERWRKQQYEAGNKKVEKRMTDGKTSYKYVGDMRDWPGFSQLPPFTGLMVETGKTSQTRKYRTFERKTSFGKWTELGSTLNAVVTISY